MSVTHAGVSAGLNVRGSGSGSCTFLRIVSSTVAASNGSWPVSMW